MHRFLLLLLAIALPLTCRAAAPDAAWSSITADGAWSGQANPRAVAIEGRTFAGWVTANGSVQVSALNHTSRIGQTFTLADKFGRDDQASPALLLLPDHRLLAFFALPGQGDLHLRATVRPGDITAWTPDRTLGLIDGKAKRRGRAGPIPVLLTNEQDAIHLFWHGANGRPTLSVSGDLGATWAAPRRLIRGADGAEPLVRAWSDGGSRIDLIFTDGQPRDEASNSLRYMRYEKGAFWKADGTRIAGLDDLPLDPAACDLVHAGTAGGRVGLGDVAADAAGRPVIAYVRLPAPGDHRYRYARWDGKAWVDQEICPGGKGFPQPKAGQQDADPYESGGLTLDTASRASVVLSRPVQGQFEIERWTTPDGGKTWTTEALTAGSRQDNVRPVVVRGQDGSGPAVLWLNLRRYAHSADFDAAVLMDLPSPKPRVIASRLTPGTILATAEAVADWQLAHPGRYRTTDWTQGALYAGMMALGGISPNPRYREAMKAVGEQNEWKPGALVYHADDHCVGQTYAELYESYREDRMLAPLRERFEYILAHPATNQLVFVGPHQEITKRWSWCDALFMAPPAWLRLYRITGDPRYRDFAVSEWWKTSGYLYDPEEHLYYRDSRYFPQREANGRKIFWSRGNGWVMGGLARVLQVLPAHDPDRSRFVTQFQEMAEAVVKCQQRDGLWRSSLLDPASYPLQETSGSGFYTFALAWGINQGLLSRTNYGPVVTRGWEGLVRCVNPDGRLTHVQPIGADPKQFDEQSTEVYGVGAFLLAATEVYRMSLLDTLKAAPVTVRNPVDARRGPETLELRWDEVAARLGGSPGNSITILDRATSKLVDHQVLDADGDGQPDHLLFQGEFLPGETRRFLLLAGLSEGNQPPPALTTHGRFVPERKDDYAWENDRIAFRVYGPALQQTPGEVSGSGVDVWLKSTRRPVLDDWYAANDYHADHGEGLDSYKVGTTRGCGGLAIKVEDQLQASANFTAWKQLAGGPIRTLVELEYAAWPAGGGQVREVKRVSLDRGSNMNRIESRLISDPPGDLTVAVGLATRPGIGTMQAVEKEGWLTYSEPASPLHGQTHTAVVMPGTLSLKSHAEHWLGVTTVKPGVPFVYFAGAGWSKADFPTPASWQSYVQLFAWKLAHPLVVKWEE